MSDDTVEETVEDAVPEAVTLHGCPITDVGDQLVVYPTVDRYVEVARALADDGYTMAVDLCGVDYLEHMGRSLPVGVEAERFEVVVQLVDIGNRRRCRMRVQVPADEPTLPSLFDLHPGVEAHERETFDMFGITFDGHPDLTRILMPEDWVGHPLRKDYEIGSIPVQFKEAAR